MENPYTRIGYSILGVPIPIVILFIIVTLYISAFFLIPLDVSRIEVLARLFAFAFAYGFVLIRTVRIIRLIAFYLIATSF